MKKSNPGMYLTYKLASESHILLQGSKAPIWSPYQVVPVAGLVSVGLSASLFILLERDFLVGTTYLPATSTPIENKESGDGLHSGAAGLLLYF
ncbi:MAG: hypothetical protein QXR48_01075 [Candidatus Woesearchaeota archaeon]